MNEAGLKNQTTNVRIMSAFFPIQTVIFDVMTCATFFIAVFGPRSSMGQKKGDDSQGPENKAAKTWISLRSPILFYIAKCNFGIEQSAPRVAQRWGDPASKTTNQSYVI